MTYLVGLFVNLFKYLGAFHMSGIVLGNGNSVINNMSLLPSICILVREAENKQVHRQLQ